jgi:hypothetical protein
MAKRSSEEARAPRIHPWEGPLPAPRISPMLSIGNIITKAKVCYETDRPGSTRGLSKPAGQSVRRSPELKSGLHAGGEISGDFKEVQNSNFK